MKTKGKSSVLFIVSIIAIIIFALVGYNGLVVAGWQFKSFGDSITKGLDLQGVVSVVIEIHEDEVTNEDLE